MAWAPIQPIYSTPSANQEIPLGYAPITIAWKGQTIVCPGQATLQLQPRPQLVFRAEVSDLATVILLVMGRRQVKLKYGSIPYSISVLTLGSKPSPRSPEISSTVEFTPSSEPVTICDDRRKRLASVTFHLMNFPAFFSQGEIGNDFWHESTLEGSPKFGCAVLENAGWRVVLQTLPTAGELLKELRVTGGYAITHVGRIERTDGRHFSISQAESALRDIHLFLSFARGLFVPLVLPVGMDRAGNRVFEEWGSFLATAWESRLSWFDEHNGQSLGELYPGFMNLLHDPDLGQAVKAALYWYLRSNRADNGAGVDSGIILSQAALEKLSKAYLRKVGLPTRGPSLIQFRKAFGHLQLPTSIPKGLAGIPSEKRSFDDLPDAITSVRNELIHSDKKLKFNINSIIPSIWNVAQWYIEICILRLSNYHGVYSNRLRAKWRGEVEQVPWAGRGSALRRKTFTVGTQPRIGHT